MPLEKLLLELQHETFDGPMSYVLPYWREFASGEQGKPLKIICRALGIPEIKYHDLRATGITLMLGNGVALPAVMKTAGHKRISSTQVYLRLSGIEAEGATDCLSVAWSERPQITEGDSSNSQAEGVLQNILSIPSPDPEECKSVSTVQPLPRLRSK